MQREFYEWLGFALLTLVGLTLALAAVTQRGYKPTFEELGEIDIGLPAAPATLDLDNLTSPEDWEILSEIHLSLVSVDSSGHIFPEVASRWTVSDEGRQFVFHLRDDLSFGSGRRLECSDVLRTFQHLTKTHMRVTSLIEGMRCTGHHDFAVRLKHPSALFLTELGDLRYSIRSLLDTRTPDLNGLGPYVVDQAALAQGSIRLKRRAMYPLAVAFSPATIRFRIVHSAEEAKRLLAEGALHLYPMHGRRASQDTPQSILHSNRRDRVWMVVVSPQIMAESPLLAACLNEKLDRKGLVRALSDPSLVTTNTLAPLSETTTSISASEELLEMPDCSRLVHRKLNVLTSAAHVERVAPALLAELARLGLRVNDVNGLSDDDVDRRLKAEQFDLALLSEGVTDSPFSDLAYFYTPSEVFPPSRWVDPTTSRLAARLSQARNEVEAKDLAQTLSGRSMRAGPYVPLFFENEHYLASRCIRLTDPEHFRLDQQFTALARERRCLD